MVSSSSQYNVSEALKYLLDSDNESEADGDVCQTSSEDERENEDIELCDIGAYEIQVSENFL